MNFSEDIFKYIIEKEQELRLENLFRIEELMKLTNDSLISNFDKFDNNYIKAVDRTIDDLYLMYSESIKTRYILVAICTYNLLKITASDLFLPFQESQLSSNEKTRPKSVHTFLKELSTIKIDKTASSQLNNNQTDNKILISEYTVNLVNELLSLAPVKMSKSFKELNRQILQTINYKEFKRDIE